MQQEVTVFKPRSGRIEGWKSPNRIFYIGGIHVFEHQIGSAILDNDYKAPAGTDRETILCGDAYPMVTELEIYHLK